MLDGSKDQGGQGTGRRRNPRVGQDALQRRDCPAAEGCQRRAGGDREGIYAQRLNDKQRREGRGGIRLSLVSLLDQTFQVECGQAAQAFGEFQPSRTPLKPGVTVAESDA